MKSKSLIKPIVTVIVLIFFLFPIFWAFLTTIKTAAEITSYPAVVIPWNPTLKGWQIVFQTPTVFISLRNSFLYALVVGALSLAIAYPITYCLSRFRFRGKIPISTSLYFIMLTPSAVLIFPLFLISTVLKFQNTVWGYILVMTSILSPFAVFLLKPYVDAVPVELDEAATVDGASLTQLLTRILLPILSDGLIASFLLLFVATFNDFAVALVMLSTEQIKTYPLLLYGFMQFLKWQGGWNTIMGMCILGFMPTVILFIIFQKYFREAVFKGSLKM